MLRELSVQNLALIEDARIELRPGYCAWTGETGAGKSLILTALGLVLGGKASGELVRKSKDEARASAVFDLANSRLRTEIEDILGGPIDDDQLILTRRISSQGRSTCHANGLPVPVATLRSLGDRLVDIHGQQDTRALLDPDRQRGLLDAFGSLESLVSEYQALQTAHSDLLNRRAELLESSANLERERALLEFEREELRSANPRAGEAEELAREAHRLANAEAVRSSALEAFASLYESDRSAQGLLESVARKLATLADAVPEFAETSAGLARLAEETREFAYSIRRFAKDSDEDPERLDEVESRLSLYRRLAARFRCGPDDLADRLALIESKLAQLNGLDDNLRSLDGPLVEAWNKLKRSASALSLARKKSGLAFARSVGAQFGGLGLDQARVTIDVRSTILRNDPFESFAPQSGIDQVEILFAPNPGEPPRPLRKIVSGGEMSRVMLAVKSVLAEADPVPTLVFDEIDSGVGGRLGAALGRKLAELATHHQIICVTHLPQMASFAAHQWIIRKKTDRGRTRTTIAPLEDEERIDEIAAMLRGDSAAEGTRQEALSMLLEARRIG